ncbi:MAG: 4Fe-4S dicluster domain-containing protein [Gammaproteobacteria bacterium]|nr:4Fe-4S dicluster domain-containing protein [Gammaproteobacteria bacterium]
MNGKANAPRWGMVVDINRCVGCQTCTAACKHANDTSPGVQWRGVLDVESGSFPDVQREFLVVGCQHCANPPCVPVCPTGATRQRADGLVTMDYDLCLGCGYCAVACPYQARTIVHDRDWYFGVETIQERAVAHDERLGVAQKCTFCVDRVDEGVELGRVPGKDLDYTPACAASCVAQAITFGDFNDQESNVSRLIRDNASFQMHAELGTDPQIKYLYEVPASPGRDPAPEDRSDEVLSDPANPLVGQRQAFWDFRAAMNFILGGMGAGLAVQGTVGHLFGGLPEPALLGLHATAGLLIAAGLFFVFMEIGRKLRFLYVLLRPQSSWMTRETYFAAVFFASLIADWIHPQFWLHGLTGIAAVGFLISQARILHAAKGIPAWRAPLLPWLIASSGLLEGAGLFALAQAIAPQAVASGSGPVAAGAVLSAATGTMWIAYRLGARGNGIPPLARRAIDRIGAAVTLFGHAVPLAGFAVAADLTGGLSLHPVALWVAGSGAILGGILWKYTIVTHASHQQGFEFPKLPQRGSGTRAAPMRRVRQ